MISLSMICYYLPFLLLNIETRDHKKIKNYFENLSNELFYEIFEYLNGCELYKAFSNLNIHFHTLLQSPSLQFKIEFRYYSKAILQYYSAYIVAQNKIRIISFTLINFHHYNSYLILIHHLIDLNH
ncbi:unnamed protein product [Rotaria sp. Silwood1]|nr:unnamed protein product [Rotaria sp. Silwood1]CAF1364965.1 unnamed protein product [Rotaria sp. Silwood1]CAF3562259.1 unnamed protein product [Rotaria sp. Silwood1]CAF4718997.1 unnamed protein product [Rotaria sp. Silwood1]CAF4736156.1 unnamed protein product [Rotaria sp. Silwood1]